MNKYCVYIHKRKDTQCIFYVGHGTLRRPSSSCKYTRSKIWLNTVAQAGGFSFEILYKNLTKSKAIEIENKLIEELPNLINSKTNRNPRNISEKDFELIRTKLSYDENSPSGLIWKYNNKVAGTIKTTNGKQYWKVVVGNKNYRVHRIVVLLNSKYINRFLVVDHIDGNGLNNKIENLRVCTQEENMKSVNTKKSDTQGVSYNGTYNYWVARWQENGNQKSKTFSCKKYGYDKAKKLALEYRKLMTESPLGPV